MIYLNFKDFVTKLPVKGPILGIDWGAKRTGTAISDDRRAFAFPRGVIVGANAHPPRTLFASGPGVIRPRNSDASLGECYSPLHRIVEIINSEKIAGIVIGLPTHADGRDSETTTRVREFAAELAKAAPDVPVTFVDERLSSAAAEEIVGANNIRTHKSKKGRILFAPTRVDAHAAAVILTDAIEMIKAILPPL